MVSMTTHNSSNPFIRFKNHVDNNIQRAFQTIFGSSVVMGIHDDNEAPDSTPDHSLSQNKTENGSSDRNDIGSVDTNHVLSWVTSSPYSPLNLQSLPQPHPSDAVNTYPDCFTFRDAFEDLLAVNSGRPLSDLRRLVLERQFEHFQFPWGMPADVWAVDLGRRGFWGAYFPLSPAARRELSYGHVLPRALWQMDDMAFHQRPISSRLDNSSPPFPFWRSHWDEWRRPLSGFLEGAFEREATTTQEQADVEDDLYAGIESEFATDSPVKTVSSLKPESAENTSSSNSVEAPITRTIETPDGGKILETIQRRVRNGKNEATTTTQQFDAHGNVIAHSKSTRIWSSWKISSGKKESRSPNDEDANSNNINKETKSTGWFWR